MRFSFNLNGREYNGKELDKTPDGIKQVQSSERKERLRINVSQEVLQHKHLCYTTNIETLGLIFQNKTIRSSSLANAKLNDRLEKQRDGISEFAGSRFITCFTHCDHESVWFWAQYGGATLKDKLFLIFENFASNIEETIELEYCWTPDKKKCMFLIPKIREVIKNARNSDEYDLRAIVGNIKLFDIEYLPADHEVFKKNYAGEAIVSFGEEIHSDVEAMVTPRYDLTCLGKQKSNPWDIEKETRIMTCLQNTNFSGFDFIDLQLKDEVFRNMEIVLSPWDDGSLAEKVHKVLSDSELNEEVKKTISVTDSLLKGTLDLEIPNKLTD